MTYTCACASCIHYIYTRVVWCAVWIHTCTAESTHSAHVYVLIHMHVYVRAECSCICVWGMNIHVHIFVYVCALNIYICKYIYTNIPYVHTYFVHVFLCTKYICTYGIFVCMYLHIEYSCICIYIWNIRVYVCAEYLHMYFVHVFLHVHVCAARLHEYWCLICFSHSISPHLICMRICICACVRMCARDGVRVCVCVCVCVMYRRFLSSNDDVRTQIWRGMHWWINTHTHK